MAGSFDRNLADGRDHMMHEIGGGGKTICSNMPGRQTMESGNADVNLQTSAH